MATRDKSRPLNPEPSYYSAIGGDMLSRANLFKFIREYLRVMQMPEGDYMEFGVFNGESLVDAYRMLRGRVRHFFGFDTFEGLPQLSPEDLQAQPFTPVFAAGNMQSMSRAEVERTVLSQTGMPRDLLTMVQGDFAESLPAFAAARADVKVPVLVAYVDCDLHSSTRSVLEFLEQRATAGTWLLLDDYWCYRGSPRHGQQRALREWLEQSRFGANDYGNFKGWGRAFLLYEK